MEAKKRPTKTVALDAGLHTEVKVLAVRRGLDLADLMNQIVADYLVKNSPVDPGATAAIGRSTMGEQKAK